MFWYRESVNKEQILVLDILPLILIKTMSVICDKEKINIIEI